MTTPWPRRWIDAHAHIFSDAPPILNLLIQANVKVLNICLSYGSVAATYRQHELAACLVKRHPAHYAFCGTFPWHDLERPDYPDQARAAIDDAQRWGAVAIKVWKDIGMECRDHAGRWVQVDHLAFVPVWEHLVKLRMPLTAHLGEPLAAWSALDPANPHHAYYSQHPEWHWYGRQDVPSHAEIMAARDRMMVRHPQLPVVGCHLASLEWDVAVLARQLDRFPQLAVDTAQRLPDLMYQDRDRVREFLIRYQDRILYGSDVTFHPEHTQPGADPNEYARHLAQTWQQDLTWLATDEQVFRNGRTLQGLALPENVLRKLLYDNACQWYKGID